jgi:hypothetical protein
MHNDLNEGIYMNNSVRANGEILRKWKIVPQQIPQNQ